MKNLGKILLGVLIIGGVVAIASSMGDSGTVYNQGSFYKADGTEAEWKILRHGEGENYTYSGHVKFPGQAWTEMATGSPNEIFAAIQDTMIENGYLPPPPGEEQASPGRAGREAAAAGV